MNKKQPIPSQKQAPKDQQKMQDKAHERPGGERVVDSEEMHRQSGHRVGDQGTHKRN